MYKQRLNAVRRQMSDGGFVISHLTNVFYLTGFTGSSALLLVTQHRQYFLTDFRYELQAKEQVPAFYTIVISKRGMWRDVVRLAYHEEVKALAFEAEHISLALFRQMQELLKTIPAVAAEGYVEKIRLHKDSTEIYFIEKAADIIDQCFEYIAGVLRPGMTEREVSDQLDGYMKKLGASGPSFPTIVASGARGALPHAEPTEKELAKGEMVTIDMGAIVEGYCSDCTRTVCLGKPTTKQQELYDVVWEAQQKALAGYMPGASCRNLNRIASQRIEQAGYGDYFAHSLGHGVGLEVHEKPWIGTKSKDILEAGMIVTCEPGIYLPGLAGVRLEQLVLITENGYQLLSKNRLSLQESINLL